MKFLKILESLKVDYDKNFIIRDNGTLLLGPDKIPNCRHMLFKPLTNAHIQEYLVSEYKNSFPEEYIKVLQYSNGANLYRVKISSEGFSFAHSMFVIFGLPMTPPFERPIDREEPFDLRIEDLSRHDKISDKWLKCGTYIKNYNFELQNDIFIDTQTKYVYSCEKNTDHIVEYWESLDECFCSILLALADSMNEYSY